MRYQISGGGWPIGSWLIPAGTIIDLPEGKAEHELTEWERIARGRLPPRDAVALMSRPIKQWSSNTKSGRSRRGEFIGGDEMVF